MRPTPIAWLLLPAGLVLGLFFGAFGLFARESVLTQIPGTAMSAGPATLSNYTAILSSGLAQRVFADTLRLSLEVTIAAAVLGYPLAFLLARSASRLMRSIIMVVLTVTFFSGGITRAYAWLILLGNNGPLNRIWRWFGFEPMKLLNYEPGVAVSLVHFVLPFFVLTMFGAVQGVPIALEEAGRNLGATRWSTFRHVTFPLSLPGLVSALLLSFTITLSSFLFPLLLGGGRVHMVASLIYDKLQTSFDMPSAAAMSVLFLLLALLPLGLVALVRLGLATRGRAAQA